MDAFVQNLRYHRNCLRKVIISLDAGEPDRISESLQRVMRDLELLNIYKRHIKFTNSYEHDSSILETRLTLNHINDSLLTSVPDIEFGKRRPKSEVVHSTSEKEQIIGGH